MIFGRLRQALAAGQPSVVATITDIQGSTYRRVGAKLWVGADGEMAGNVSGGCLEVDVRDQALSVIKDGTPKRLHYDTSEAEDRVWGMGLGCNGQVDLLLQRYDACHQAFVEAVSERLAADQPFAIRLGLAEGDRDQRTVLVGEETASSAAPDCFIDRFEPPPIFLICGAGDDALPLAKLADEVGFRVALIDHRSAYLTADRFPQARWRLSLRPEEGCPADWPWPQVLAVVKTHAVQLDLEWVQALMAKPIPYIGLLGPRERRDEVRAVLAPDQLARLYGPVGLDLGGEGPEQVALSAVAEALAVWNGRNGGFLRDRRTAIHATDEGAGDVQ